MWWFHHNGHDKHCWTWSNHVPFVQQNMAQGHLKKGSYLCWAHREFFWGSTWEHPLKIWAISLQDAKEISEKATLSAHITSAVVVWSAREDDRTATLPAPLCFGELGSSVPTFRPGTICAVGFLKTTCIFTKFSFSPIFSQLTFSCYCIVSYNV